VLLHELAHIARGDLAAQALAQAACSLYWFHPLAWIAAARLRNEREHACDDAVLFAGAQPHEYAADLVDLARGLAARRVWAGSPAMAETSNLETRVRALFDNTRNRRPLQMKAVITIGIAALALLVPVASLTVHAQGSAALGGIVIDPSGAVVPNARVTARNQDGSAPLTTAADAAGTYRFTAIPPGKYTLEFASPGFKLLKQDLTVAAGQGVRQDANLQLGEINESITIHARNAAAAAPAGHPIRVGGNVQPARLIKQTRPEYPADLQQAGVEGTVMIRAVVSKDGSLLSPQVINTEIDSRLADLALSAIRQWRYQPSLLNGEPVEVLTTVSVDFKLN
jgi:TonB family protein